MGKQDNKFLTFGLKEEKYGIPITKVKEIIGMMDITRVPKLPDFIRGVINLRGKIIPVIDLRLKFELEKIDYNERTSIIITELKTQSEILTSGFIVDSVNDVQDISPDNIEPPPKYGVNIGLEFLNGMGKIKDEVIMLLDIDKIFSHSETAKLESVKVQ